MPIRHQGGVTGLKGRQGKQLTGYWKNKPPRPSNFSHESLSSDILVRAGSPSRMPAPNPGQKKKKNQPQTKTLSPEVRLGEVGSQQQVRTEPAARSAGAPGLGAGSWGWCVCGAGRGLSNIPRTQVFSRRWAGRGQWRQRPKFGATLPPRGRHGRFAAGAARGLEVWV